MPNLPTYASLLRRLQLEGYRLQLAWHALRHGRGRPVSLVASGTAFRVDDGLRSLHLPSMRRATRYRRGINARLQEVAELYGGGRIYRPREGDCVVDIGAGVGEFALWCCDHGTKVVAFEPDPLAFRCLAANLPRDGDAIVLPYALWKRRQDLKLHAASPTLRSSLIAGERRGPTVAVEAWPLDSVPAVARLPAIDFLKVDGVGVEPEILAGAAAMLRRTRLVAVDLAAAPQRPGLDEKVTAVLRGLRFSLLPGGGGRVLIAANTAMPGRPAQ